MKPWRVSLFLLLIVSAVALAVWQKQGKRTPTMVSKALQQQATPARQTTTSLRLLLLIYRPGKDAQAELAYAWFVNGNTSDFPHTLEFTPLFPAALTTPTSFQDTTQWAHPLRASGNTLQPDEAAIGKFIHHLGLPPIDLYTTLWVSDVNAFMKILMPSSNFPDLDTMLQGTSPEEQKKQNARLIQAMCGAYSSAPFSQRQVVRERFTEHALRWGNPPPDIADVLKRLLDSPGMKCSLGSFPP